MLLLWTAVLRVKEEGWSYGEATKATGIPKTTIFKYSKETVIKKQRPGPVAILMEDKRIRRRGLKKD